jgi:hypothetical protein
MLKVAIFLIYSLPKEPISYLTLDYKDSVNPTWGVEIVVQHDVEAICTNF